MKHYILYGGIGLVLVAIVAFFIFNKPVEAPTVSTEGATVVSELRGRVLITKDGNEREVNLNEKVFAPFDLRSETGGYIVIALPDSSELRMDQDSRMHVAEAQYSGETRNLAVRVKLSLGKVWSNITSLATPESAWEVETSNVVATVRGTAFGVEAHDDGVTTIIGSEHTIELTLINPDTGERDPNRRIMLDESESIMISNDDGRDGSKTPLKQKRTDGQNSNSWVQQNEGIDAGLETEIGATGDGTVMEVKTESTLEIQTVSPAGTQTTDLIGRPIDSTTVTPPRSSGGTGATAKTPVSISVATSPSLTQVVEGAVIIAKATLTYSDKSTSDVTGEVTWGVIGKIGTMRGNIFTATLDASLAEYGKAPGSITATWKDATGKEYFGSTLPFEVAARVYYLTPQG